MLPGIRVFGEDYPDQADMFVRLTGLAQGTRNYQAHVKVCKRGSGALRTMLTKATSKMNGLPVVTLELGDRDEANFELVLRYLYTEELAFVDSEHCRGVMLIADRLNMAQLRYTCVEFMSSHRGSRV